MSNIITNVAGIAAIALIAVWGVSFLTLIIVAALGHPVDPTTASTVNTLTQVVIGIAVGAGLGGAIAVQRMSTASK